MPDSQGFGLFIEESTASETLLPRGGQHARVALRVMNSEEWKQISTGARVVYPAVASFIDHKTMTYRVSVAHIAERAGGYSEKHTRALLSELVRAGLLGRRYTRYRTRDGQVRQDWNQWVLLDPPSMRGVGQVVMFPEIEHVVDDDDLAQADQVHDLDPETGVLVQLAELRAQLAEAQRQLADLHRSGAEPSLEPRNAPDREAGLSGTAENPGSGHTTAPPPGNAGALSPCSHAETSAGGLSTPPPNAQDPAPEFSGGTTDPQTDPWKAKLSPSKSPPDRIDSPAGDSPRTPLADQDQDLVELVTELVEQLSEAGALPQQRRVDVNGLPVGPDPAAEERQTREELRFVETSIAVLEDAGDVGDIELYTATFPEVEAADPSIRERMYGWQDLTEADRELMQSKRDEALARLQRERTELQAKVAELEKPDFSAWEVVAESHKNPAVFGWLLEQVRQRRCGIPGAAGRSIRKRTLGRALDAAVRAHSARMAS